MAFNDTFLRKSTSFGFNTAPQLYQIGTIRYEEADTLAKWLSTTLTKIFRGSPYSKINNVVKLYSERSCEDKNAGPRTKRQELLSRNILNTRFFNIGIGLFQVATGR